MHNLILIGLKLLLWVLSVGGMVYFLLAILAARRLKRRPPETNESPDTFPPVSILKPLCGIDPELGKNLETFFQQDYPDFEILFAVRDEADPSVALVQELMQRFAHIPCTLMVTGAAPYPNAKVFSLEKMALAAKHSLLVVTDSDVSVARTYLRTIAVAFSAKKVGLVTNLYRGVGGQDLWSKLEALGMSTEFMAGVIVAEFLEGMKFSLGPSMAISTPCLRAIGGFASLSEYLADDFVLGEKVFRQGFRVVLSTHVINHHAYAAGFQNSFKHRLRWNRSSRFSRPAGYIGQSFTYGLPWAIFLFLVTPTEWSAALLLGSVLLRGWLAYTLGKELLGDSSVVRRLWLVPLQDGLSFATWVVGFFGREVVWRGVRYRILPGGRFTRIPGPLATSEKE
jgi:ceramide glucosyltransferase